MRYAQIGLATLGVIASAVATAFAIADGVRGPYPTAPGFYAAGAALITLGGLGLTLARTFIQQHHGTVEFESEPGRTIFKIVIPL